MAPASLTVKSESWLDLAQISSLAELQQSDNRRRRRLIKQSSVPPESARHSSSSLVAARHCATNNAEQSIASSITSLNGGGGKQSNEHLLIRMRQRSYLNRSNSTTLSSNLSNSIELSRAPSSQSIGITSGDHLFSSRSIHQEAPQTNSINRQPRTDLSFGLRSFRNRFERRFKKQRRQIEGNKEETNIRSFQQEPSPLARSWSSLSEQVSSQLNHLGHSWKSFLYNYQQQRLASKSPSHSQQSANICDKDQQRSMKQQSDRLGGGGEGGPPPHVDANELELHCIKRRLTADWIRRHHHHDHSRQALTCEHEEVEQNYLHQSGKQIASTPLRQEANVRPQSVYLPCNNSRRNSSSVDLQGDEEASSHHLKRANCWSPSRLARSQSQQPSSGAQSNRATGGRLVAQRRVTPQSSSSTSITATETTTNTSATLVESDSNLLQFSNNTTRSITQPRERVPEFSSKQTSTTSCNNKRTQLLPVVATSDYWSSSALTTATKSSANSGAIEMQLQQRDKRRSGGRKSTEFFPNDHLAPGEQLSSARQLVAASDQDYYLDVAAAAQFNINNNQNNTQFSNSALNEFQNVISSNLMFNRRSLQGRHHQLAPPSQQQVANYLNNNDEGNSAMPLNNNLFQQQQQQMLLFEDQTSEQFKKQYQEDSRLSEQQLLSSLTGGSGGGQQQLDDYDDYAVPSDESCCRLERSQVELVQLIGEGQKGYVFLGKLQSRSGHPATMIDVAIKTLKYETDQLIDRLMSEAAMMKQLEHPHIIKFIGMCPETPALIAMELARYGEIKHFLKLHQNAIKISQLVLFAFQISTALSYLESKNYVHRDVAARNVLVCSPQCVKLADFGLSRHLQPATKELISINQQQQVFNYGQNAEDGQQLYVAAPRVKLPVRWLAPESLVFRRFTSASDVWMFAVCAWELFHFGLARPWPQLRNNQVLLAIEAGQRLGQPEACPQRLYQLMLKCWSYAPVQRPKFREIKQSIWSIYLNERTREQLEVEQFERAKQRYLISQQQQQLAAAAASCTQAPNAAQAAPPPSYSTYSSTNTTTDRSTSPGSSSAGFNSMGRHHHHHNTNTNNNNNNSRRQMDLNEAAFYVTQQPEVEQQPRAASRQMSSPAAALQAQWDRFQRRQSPGKGGVASQVALAQQSQAGAEGNSRRQTPHMLQKQRSQGAIPSGESGAIWRKWPVETSDRRQQAAADNRAASQKVRESINSKKPAQLRRSPPKRRPLDDGEALEMNRGGELAQRTRQRLYAAALKDIDCEEEEELEEIQEKRSSSNSRQVAPEVRRTIEHERLLNCHLTSRNFDQNPTFQSSVSPALTTSDSETHLHGRLSASSHCSPRLEPTYEGLATSGGQQQLRHHAKLSSGNQVAMLRAKYDPSQPPAPSSPNFRQLTSSPALTATTQTPASRPASWRSDCASQQKMEAAEMRVPRPPDQLGQMLQALRITPMKARLKTPPEQTVRVLQRAPEAEMLVHQAPAPVQDQQPEVPIQPSKQTAGNRLLLHQRLLGRIRPLATTTNNMSEQLKSGENNKPRAQQQQQVNANETTVEQSLQLLESLMQPREQSQQLASSTASLPRARSRHLGEPLK